MPSFLLESFVLLYSMQSFVLLVWFDFTIVDNKSYSSYESDWAYWTFQIVNVLSYTGAQHNY